MSCVPSGLRRVSSPRFLFGLLVVAFLLACQGGSPAITAQTVIEVFLPQISKECRPCYFVDSLDGDDANPGTSEDRPWKSLSRVSAAPLPPMSSVLFKRGSSWIGELSIGQSGQPGAPITFGAYGGGPRPIISNPGPVGSFTRGIVVTGDWIVLRGLEVRDTAEAAIKLMPLADHNIIDDVELWNAGFGIQIDSAYNVVSRAYIHDLHMVVNTFGGNDDYGAVGITLVGGRNNEISYSAFARCRAPSLDYGQDGGAIEWYGPNTDANYVHHNWVSDSDGFFEIGGGSTANSVVAYNVSVNNDRFLLLNLDGKYASTITNLRVENNTIVEISDSQRGWVVLGFSAAPTENTLSVRNNLFYVSNYNYVSNFGSFAHSHNLYALQNGTNVGYVLLEGEGVADPLFRSLESGDFHLLASSPAINGGLSLGYQLDYDDRPVPVGIAPDIGAFEAQIAP